VLQRLDGLDARRLEEMEALSAWAEGQLARLGSAPTAGELSR
jgi:hypothetical protein